MTTGKPVPNMGLQGYAQAEDNRYVASLTAKTNANDRFKIPVTPTGSLVSLQWERSQTGDYLIDEEWQQQDWRSRQPLQNQVVKQDKSDLLIKVKLRKVGNLIGHVVNGQKEGVKGAMVYLYPTVPPVGTDATGARFRSGSRPGTAISTCAP